MRVTLVADSCFLFEHKGVRLLTDPWIGTSIYGGAWLQFPAPVLRADQIGRLDYIFISHIHEDHCDLSTIRQLDRNARVILMDRKPNFVENFLRYHRLEFREIINVPLRTQYQIGEGMSLEVIEADPSHALNHMLDSALLIHYGDKSIYFANDNPPYEAIDGYLKRYNFELALLPPAGGSGYPAFYDSLTDEEKRIRAAQIIDGYQEELLRCLQRIRPRLFGCAANAHVIAGKNSALNEFMAWPASASSPYRYISKHRNPEDKFRAVVLHPGDSTELESDEGVDVEMAIQFYENSVERAQFVRDVASQVPYVYEPLQLGPSVSFPRLLEAAYPRLLAYLERAKLDIPWKYYFAYPHDKYASVSLQPPYKLTPDDQPGDTNRLIVTCEPRLLYLLLTGGFSWNIADVTGFVHYDRRPDTYVYEMYIALNHFRI